jgi:hypothetical protein
MGGCVGELVCVAGVKVGTKSNKRLLLLLHARELRRELHIELLPRKCIAPPSVALVKQCA